MQVLSGFTSAAAVLISASQLKHLLGMHLPRMPFLHTLHHIATHLEEVNLLALAVGLAGVGVLSGLKALNKKLCPAVPLPEQLLLIVLATLLCWATGLELPLSPPPPPSALAANASLAAPPPPPLLPAPPLPRFFLPVVGRVPSGLPRFTPPPVWEWELVGAMLKPALVVGTFSFILSMSIVRTFALKYEYTTDSNQELLALGAANIIGALFLSYPAAGSLSRSALVSTSAGPACTPMHGVFTALLVLLVLLLLTPAFRPMPRAVLASIVFMAVKGLFDIERPRFLFRVKMSDFVAWCTAFFATITLGVQLGISTGVFTSMVLIVLRSARPNYAVLGRLPRSNIFRDVRRYPEAIAVPGVMTFRFDSSLHFANKGPPDRHPCCEHGRLTRGHAHPSPPSPPPWPRQGARTRTPRR